VLVVGPIGAFVGIVIGQALEVSEKAIPWARAHFGASSGFNVHDWLVTRFPVLGGYLPQQDVIIDNMSLAAKSAGGFLVAAASRMTAGTAAFLLNAFVMLYAMFFFLRDGESILQRVFYYIPLSHEDEERMLERFTSVTRATIKGTVIIGVVKERWRARAVGGRHRRRGFLGHHHGDSFGDPRDWLSARVGARGDLSIRHRSHPCGHSGGRCGAPQSWGRSTTCCAPCSSAKMRRCQIC
jgi:hypothetical protein